MQLDGSALGRQRMVQPTSIKGSSQPIAQGLQTPFLGEWTAGTSSAGQCHMTLHIVHIRATPWRRRGTHVFERAGCAGRCAVLQFLLGACGAYS